MTENEAIEAMKLEGGIEIAGNPRRIAKFFEALDMAISALKEIQQYRKIGTVEECREAREKQKAKTRKTRKSKFLEMFPDAPITDGIPCVSPCDLSTKVTDKGGLCDEYSENSDCKECRRKYWLEEME